jgi:hypothetical protein
MLIILSCMFFNYSTSAQTTVVNTPSTDIVPEKRIFIEADFAAHIDSYEKGGFQTYGYRTAYGLTKNLEVGANVFYTKTGDGSPGEFQPNLKYKFFEDEKNQVTITGGVIGFVPLNDAAGSRTFGLVYSNASKVVRKAKGMRVTGGAYTVVGSEDDFGTKSGAILGLEQPIAPKVKFVADWYSGKNRFGYSAAGVNYSITKKQFVFAGYNFGNTGRANNFLSVFYGYSF